MFHISSPPFNQEPASFLSYVYRLHENNFQTILGIGNQSFHSCGGSNRPSTEPTTQLVSTLSATHSEMVELSLLINCRQVGGSKSPLKVSLACVFMTAALCWARVAALQPDVWCWTLGVEPRTTLPSQGDPPCLFIQSSSSTPTADHLYGGGPLRSSLGTQCRWEWKIYTHSTIDCLSTFICLVIFQSFESES